MKLPVKTFLMALACSVAMTASASQPSLAYFRVGFRQGLPVAKVEAVPAGHVFARGARFDVGFSPGDAEALVLDAILSAHEYIDIAAYSFTSRPISSALLAAARRGVKVDIVADKGQRDARYTSVRYLARKGIPVRYDSHYAIMHNKFMVIDGNEVETGSFNYTRSAQVRNAENVIVLTGVPVIATTYQREWNRLWGESQP